MPSLFTRLAPLTLASLLAACASNDAPPEPQAQAKPIPQLPVHHSTVIKLRGELSVSKQAINFSSCQGEASFAVKPSAKVQQQLSKVPHTGTFYVEANGSLENSKSASQAGEIELQSIEHLVIEGHGCRADASQIRAQGNEPGWFVEIAQGKLQLSSINGKWNEKLISSGIKDGVRYWNSSSMRLSMTKRDCYDSMVGNYYQYQAELAHGDRTYQGCAKLPFNQQGQELAGYYQAQVGNDKHTLAIELNSDMSASMQNYVPASEQLDAEQGYWYPTADNKLHLHLKNEQYPSGMHFSWNGLLLKLDNPESIGWGKQTLALKKMDGPLVTASAEPDNSYHARSFEPATIMASDALDTEVEAALRQYFVLHRTEPAGSRYLWWKFDLNGDGIDEILTYLNWCGSGGCSLLIFEGTESGHRFLSKTTLVHTPFYLASTSFARWQDLLIEVSGGGATPGLHQLQFDGLSYPLNPSVQPRIDSQPPLSGITFATEQLSPGWGRELN